MSTTPTNNPVPSESPRDLKFNAGKIDEFVTSLVNRYIDRFGNEHYTAKGLENLVRQIVSTLGFVPFGTFEAGATLSDATQTLKYEADGNYYRWDGDFPKLVDADSTPDSTGGVTQGAWVNVTDLTLRTALASSDGATMSGYGKRTVAESLPLYTSSYGIGDSGKSGVDNANLLNSLIDYAISNNRLTIFVDQDASIDDVSVQILKKTEVFFYNAGGTLTGLYRRAQISENSPSNVRLRDDIQQNSMRRFYNATSPVVVIMGDSISTDGPNALAKSDSMWSLIKKKISKQNKAKTINFYNRAIGGQTWLTANSTPTAFPDWYTNTSTAWLDYVQALEPDLLFLAFGMNDSNGFNAGAFFSVINKINQWSKIPSICIITNPVPAMNVTWESGSGFYATVFQEGRDFAANYARSYAQWAGYSILDMNRQFNLIRDGRDTSSAPFYYVGNIAKSYLNGDVSMLDFSYKFTVTNWATDKVLSVKCGLGTTDNIYIKNLAGYYQVSAFASSSVLSTYYQVTTTTAVSAGSVVEVTVRANRAYFYVDSVLVLEFNIIRHGGLFASVVGFQDDLTTGPFTSIEVSRGLWLQCQYTARDSDIWGPDDGTAGAKYQGGGNGINHYSSQGLGLICAPVIDAADFSPEVETQEYSINTLADSGATALTAIKAYLANGEVVLQGRLKTTTAASVTLFALPTAIIPSDTRYMSTQALAASWAGAIVTASSVGIRMVNGSATNMLILDGLRYRI